MAVYCGEEAKGQDREGMTTGRWMMKGQGLDFAYKRLHLNDLDSKWQLFIGMLMEFF